MIASSSKYESLASRAAFNESVKQVKATISLAERLDTGENLADAINFLADNKQINRDGILPFISMLLVDKYAYRSISKNMEVGIPDQALIQKTVAGWDAFDMVLVYHHPDIGLIVVNPKNSADIGRIDRINKTELLVVYLGCFGKSFDQALAQKAGEALLDMYEGKKPKDNPSFLKGSCKYKAPKAEAVATNDKKVKESKAKTSKGKQPPKPKKSGSAPSAKIEAAASPTATSPAQQQSPAASTVKTVQRMTPMYGVLVTNELFHNGNVEAWKKIIDSYRSKHTGLDVLVYYDGERIVNLNALFKWGKVKHGSVIQFAVAGENISDVAKLQRYLAQGASPMFEAFLRGPVNSILALF